MNTKYCCTTLQQQLEWKCKQHDNPWDCPDPMIVKMQKGYALPIRDGGYSGITIKFCPFCGAKLP